jgi:purine nucleosidase
VNIPIIGGGNMKVKNILLFSDFGIDDMVAAAFAVSNEEINVVGIVADYGNVSKEKALQNASYLRNLTGLTEIPVFGGAGLPLTGDTPEFYPEIHGLSGLGPILNEVVVDVDFFENFDEIKRIIDQYENDLLIVNIGRLSSLATAFILYPNLLKQVSDIYIMGGAFFSPGNVTAVAEANIYGDPYAANIVLTHAPKKVFIIPLDVTMSAILTPALVDRLHEYFMETGNQFGLLLKPMIDYYFKFYKDQFADISGSPMHDLLTFWAIMDESSMEYIEAPVKVVVDKGAAFGQTIGDFRKLPSEKKENYKVHYIGVKYDYSQFIQTYYRVMTNPVERVK